VRLGNAFAKINLALVVGPRRPDGKHELATVYQRVGLVDLVSVEPGSDLHVTGFEGDTLVTRALRTLGAAAAVEPNWHVHIEKAIPVAAGLGGGSSDAAAALELANESLDSPLGAEPLRLLAAEIGADVPLFLEEPGPLMGTGDGTTVVPVDLPTDYTVLLVLPHGAVKESTASVYAAFDQRGGERGFDERRRALVAAIAVRDLRGFPKNDLASSPLAAELERLGAFRADVSGAGPTVYGLFENAVAAEAARPALEPEGAIWICTPTWYG
jgi:4-diphosphocytidyl-2-C-methyl-D-erythritol kinase